MEKIYIAHDFNLNLKNFKLPIDKLKKNLLGFNKTIIFIDINKIKNFQKSKINVYWGNRLNIDILKNLPKLNWVHFGSSGINDGLLEILKSKKIIITNSTGVFSKAIAQTILAYILYLHRGIHISQQIRDIKKFNRIEFEKNSPNLLDIDQCKIIIFGYGSISKQVINYLGLFNKNIFIVSNQKNVSNTKIKKTYNYNNVNRILSSGNIIINILPLNHLTYEYFDRKKFNFFKKKPVFINVGRGDTVNKNDLIYAVNNNMIQYYCSDVYNKIDYVDPYSPLKNNSKILSLKNSILTPHIAGFENSYWDKQIGIFLTNLNIYLKKTKKKYLNLVK